MLSIGQALLLASTLSILPHYFKKKLSLANGLTNSIAAVIVVLLPYIISLILESTGLKEGFYFLSFLNLIASLMCLTYRTTIHSSCTTNATLANRIKESFGLEVLKEKQFLVWCSATFIGKTFDTTQISVQNKYNHKFHLLSGILGYLIPIIVIVSYLLSNFLTMN